MDMTFKNFILISLLLNTAYFYAQSISETDKILIDSLKKEKFTVFLIAEYCIGRSNISGEFTTNNSSTSCTYSDVYWILWMKSDLDSIKSKMTNECYSLVSTIPAKNLTSSKLEQLFERIFIDSSINERWIEPKFSDTNYRYPITGSDFYKISKFGAIREYSINFSEHLLSNNLEKENSKKVEFLINEILIEFEKEIDLLSKKGKKNEVNWK
jgi:hypothetical protein